MTAFTCRPSRPACDWLVSRIAYCEFAELHCPIHSFPSFFWPRPIPTPTTIASHHRRNRVIDENGTPRGFVYYVLSAIPKSGVDIIQSFALRSRFVDSRMLQSSVSGVITSLPPTGGRRHACCKLDKYVPSRVAVSVCQSLSVRRGQTATCCCKRRTAWDSRPLPLRAEEENL